MDDLISRQDAVDAMCKLMGSWFGGDPKDEREEIAWIINHLPSAQPEIIRCKDCLHWVRTCGDNQWGLGDCDVFDKHLVMCEGYCAWAERREE